VVIGFGALGVKVVGEARIEKYMSGVTTELFRRLPAETYDAGPCLLAQRPPLKVEWLLCHALDT